MKLQRLFTAMTMVLALAGCESIGEGSTIQSLKLQAGDGRTEVAPFVLNRCLRDQLVVIATFTDGTTADFSYRAAWSSSNPAVVQVSNNDIGTVFIDDGAFVTASNVPYRPGTIVPAATSGTATITASFLGMSSSMDVRVGTPVFKVAPVTPGVDPNVQPALTTYLGPDTLLRFGFYVEQEDGRTLTSSSLNSLAVMNPILWRFVGGEFDPADPAVTNDFDKYAVPTAAAPTAVINPASGTVIGMTPDTAATYEVEAVSSLCQDDAAFKPTAPLQVAPFATTNPLTLAHVLNFNGPGVTPTGDIISGTSELVRVTANLDTDADGAGDQAQDISGQVDFIITHLTACVAGSTNCTCDTGNVNCSKRLVANRNQEFFVAITNDSADARAQACFTNIDTLHTDDCEEDAAGEDAALRSNLLDFHAIPVDLTGANATLFIEPGAPAPERAFTYPGRLFTGYGTFKALTGTPFAGGTSDTGTQRLREVVYVTRDAGATTGFATAGFARSTSDGFFADVGSFVYLLNPAANTSVDITLSPLAPFTAVPASAPVTFTICPRDAASCP